MIAAEYRAIVKRRREGLSGRDHHDWSGFLFGVMSAIICVVLYSGCFVIDSCAMLVRPLLGCMFMSRSDVEISSMDSFPNSFKALGERVPTIWNCVRSN